MVLYVLNAVSNHVNIADVIRDMKMMNALAEMDLKYTQVSEIMRVCY